MALLAASRRQDHHCVTPMALFEELEALCTQTSVYEFLRLQTEGEYHRPRAFIEAVRQWYLDVVEDELHTAMGLVDRGATTDLFARYIDHVLHYVRKEKRYNPVTGQYEEPDEKLMTDVERRFGAKPKSAADVRMGIMHRIAAWRMDHPEETLDFDRIFADHIERINDAFYDEKRKVADQVKRDLLTFVIEGGERLDDEARARAEATLSALEHDFGYCRPCAVEVVSYLLKHRPAPN
jgi:serine protein kinase